MNQIEYFFYEWLIIEKKLNKEQFKQLNSDEFKMLKHEFIKFYNRVN
jgi:hypothetical protein